MNVSFPINCVNYEWLAHHCSHMQVRDQPHQKSRNISFDHTDQCFGRMESLAESLLFPPPPQQQLRPNSHFTHVHYAIRGCREGSGSIIWKSISYFQLRFHTLTFKWFCYFKTQHWTLLAARRSNWGMCITETKPPYIEYGAWIKRKLQTSP